MSAPKFRYGIVGGGISGRAAKRLLAALGHADVKVYDQKPGEGDYTDETDFLHQVEPSHLVVSPGVPLSTPWIRAFHERGGILTSELALAVETLESEQIVGVTGSLGKSTTVSLVGAAMEAAGFATFVGGNLGVPLSAYAADVLERKRSRVQWIALELSSYQLENAGNLRCAASVITYLSSNHLERYVSLEDYYRTKIALAARTENFVVLNENGGDLRAYESQFPAKPERVWVSRESAILGSFRGRVRLVGSHNLDNVAMAATVAERLGWPASYADGIRNFAGLAHRLEDLGTIGGVRFVNDSKGTSMDSVETALRAALESTAPRIWCLLGGKDKQLPWPQLKDLLRESRLTPVYFGAAREIAARGVARPGESFASLLEALRYLAIHAKSGDWVVMSPGGTSLDEFKNFEDRGEFFRKSVKELFRGRNA